MYIYNRSIAFIFAKSLHEQLFNSENDSYIFSNEPLSKAKLREYRGRFEVKNPEKISTSFEKGFVSTSRA